MQLTFSNLDNDIRLIKLNGRLDIIGKGEIETKFTAYCSGENVRVIIDFTEVDFLASIGIQLLFINAKTVARRGGKMVISNPDSNVSNVMDLAGIPSIIPVYADFEAARVALSTF